MEIPEDLAPASAPPTGGTGVLRLLRSNPHFRLLFAAMVVSFGGDWFLFVALTGLIFDLTGSAALVAWLYAAMTVPFALFTFVGGPLADRVNRQFLMATADVLRAALVLGFFLVDRPSQVWVVFLLAGGVSALQAAFEPAAMASVPNLVSREDLPAANVLAAATWGTMLMIGSALGGLVVAAFGREVGYLVDAASFALSAGLVLAIRRPFSRAREPHHEHPSLLEATRETLRYARRDRRVLALLTVKGGFGLGAGAIALIPVLAFEVYQAGERGVGILYAFRGVGLVAGPVLARRMMPDWELPSLFRGIAVAFLVFAASYAVVPWMPLIWLAGVFVLAGHLGGGAQWMLSSFGLQVVVPDHIRGRIFGFDEALISAAVAVSATVSGWIANTQDVRVVMLGLAGVSALYSAIWIAATTGIRAGRGARERPAA